MSKANTKSETRTRALSLKDMAVGQSVIGYVKDLFKVPTSLTPDVENIALVTKEGEEITVWSAGTLKYFRERMEKAGVGLGVLTKITKIDRPDSANKKSRQKYFADIKFNKSDIKDPSTLGTRYSGGSAAPDAEGFSDY